jgi:hypothetical protein
MQYLDYNIDQAKCELWLSQNIFKGSEKIGSIRINNCHKSNFNMEKLNWKQIV